MNHLHLKPGWYWVLRTHKTVHGELVPTGNKRFIPANVGENGDFFYLDTWFFKGIPENEFIVGNRMENQPKDLE